MFALRETFSSEINQCLVRFPFSGSKSGDELRKSVLSKVVVLVDLPGKKSLS